MIFVSRLLDTDFTIVVEGEESSKAFKEMVQRATNLWPDASPEIKRFADKITNANWMTDANSTSTTAGGLQAYEKQDTSPGANERRKKQLEQLLKDQDGRSN